MSGTMTTDAESTSASPCVRTHSLMRCIALFGLLERAALLGRPVGVREPLALRRAREVRLGLDHHHAEPRRDHHEVRLAERPGPALREVERVQDDPIRRAGALQLVEERALGGRLGGRRDVEGNHAGHAGLCPLRQQREVVAVSEHAIALLPGDLTHDAEILE